METMILDSIAGGIARLEREDGTFLELPRSWMPENARDGAVLSVSVESGSATAVRFSLDRESEDLRRAAVRSKLDRLRTRRPGNKDDTP